MYKVKVNNKESFEINSKLDMILNTADNVTLAKNANGTFDVKIENQNLNASIIDWDQETKIAKIKINQNLYIVHVQEPADLLLENLGMTIPKAKKANSLKSPMPGLILKIIGKPGQAIKKGESLLILEAMKMENVFKAGADCVIKEIKIEQNQAVEKGQELITFE
jgi:biotin carboxyl carrier protein